MSNDDNRNRAREPGHGQSRVSAPGLGELVCRGAKAARLVASAAALSVGLMACAHAGSIQQTVDREVLRHGMPREFGENSNVTVP